MMLLDEWREMAAPLRYIDDVFFAAALDGDKDTCQVILRTLLEDPGLVVLRVAIQKRIVDPVTHDAVLDVLAEIEYGPGSKYGQGRAIVDIEMQNSTRSSENKRIRFYGADLDADQLRKGEGYSDLQDMHVVFVMQEDKFGAGVPLYHIRQFVDETGELYEDGSHKLIVNGTYDKHDAVGDLLRDLKRSDPDEIRNQVLAERMRFLKRTEEGIIHMRKDLVELVERTYNAEMKRMGDELETTKDELDTTKDKLETAKDELETTKDELEKARKDSAAKDRKIAAMEQKSREDSAAKDREIARLTALLEHA